jgi:hypothetical protein
MDVLKTLDKLIAADEVTNGVECESLSVKLLLELGDQQSKTELDGGNDPDFTDRWKKIRPRIENWRNTMMS